MIDVTRMGSVAKPGVMPGRMTVAGDAASAPSDTFAAAAPSPLVIPRPVAPSTIDAPYRAAVARIQAVVDRDLALQKTPGPDGLSLRPHTESLFSAQPQPGAKGTVVMYHGYTAAPWQYREMAQRFYDAGYNVYVPRMPGHGFADATGTPTGAKLPNSHQRDVWEQFIDQTVEDASALGAPVYVVGLSGGANVALRAGEKHPEIKGVAALSPYLGGNPVKGLIFPVMDDLDAVTFGGFGHLMDHKPFEKNPLIPNDPTPHTRGSVGQALVMQELGHNVKHVGSPVQILSTDGDFLSGSCADSGLLKKCGGAAHSGWYRFHKDEHVPHAMLSPLENKAPGACQKVQDVVFDFIDKGQTASRA